VHSELGTEPKQIVESAEAEFQRTRGYERIYVVFDRDDHLTYANAIAMAESRNKRLRNDERRPVTFEAIVSVPCFELWLLLHFSDIQAWLHRDEALQPLRGFLPGYSKDSRNAFNDTPPHLPAATARAAALRARFSRLPGTEAYTDVDELVATLRALRAPHP
jgi:hypothetical protein